MEPMILKDRNVPPEKEVLKKALTGSYPVYETFCGKLSDLGIVPEWNYYNDGKAWLCKLRLKKKNPGWAAVYDGFFRVTCYFTEKHLEAIAQSQIPEKIREDFYRTKSGGKLLPMIIRVAELSEVEEAMAVIRFKISLK